MGEHPGTPNGSDRIRTIATQPVTSVEEAAAQIHALAEHAAQIADELADLRRTTGEEHVELKARLRAAGHRIDDLESRSQRSADPGTSTPRGPTRRAREVGKESVSPADGRQPKNTSTEGKTRAARQD